MKRKRDIFKTLANIQKALNKTLRPHDIEQIHKTTEAISRNFGALDSMARLGELMRENLRTMGMSVSKESMMPGIEVAARIRESLRGIDTMAKIGESMGANLRTMGMSVSKESMMPGVEAAARIKESIRANFSSLDTIATALQYSPWQRLEQNLEALAGWEMPGVEIQNLLKAIDIFEQFQDVTCAYESLPHEIETQEGQIFYGGENYTLEDVRNVHEESLRAIDFGQSPNIVIQNLVININGEERPLYKRLLIWMFNYFLWGLIFHLLLFIVVDPYVMELWDGIKDKKVLIKSKKQSILNQTADKSVLKDRRIVKKYMEIREKKKLRSKRIGFLRYLDEVRIVKKRRNWSLVECKTGNNGSTLKGWVLTRYLERFK